MRVPAGYEAFHAGVGRVVARATLVEAVREAVAKGTLYDYAAHHPKARPLRGRGVSYVVPLPDGATWVVVRHSRHGGLLAGLTGDRFLGGTRAPRELETSLRLARSGVPTPEVLAYAVYPAGPLLHRADVVTREVRRGQDLAGALTARPEAKRALLDAVARLLERLAEAGARHPDLNLRNVLVAPDENDRLEAYVLDVDRVWFDDPASERTRAANRRRLERSARKLREHEGLPIDEGDLAWLASGAEGR